MTTIPSADWKHQGKTANADFYALDADVLVIVPQKDTSDDAETARASIEFQREHWTRLGHRGAVIVWMDPVLQQDSGARDVYADTEGHPSTCFALVSETLFAQASAAVFTGLARPAVPTRVFKGIEEAIAWAREMNRAHGGPA